MAEQSARMPRRERLGVGWRGVRRAVRRDDASASDSEADPAVLDLAREPWTSVAEARDALAALERLFAARRDRRAVFLTLYGRVTDAIVTRIEEGGFVNPEWMADYLVAFADWYRTALLAFERPDETPPEPWAIAFESAVREENLVTQDALLGINAHVMHDLPFVLEEVGIDPDRRSKYEDHCAVNEVLRRVTNDAQDLLAETYARGIADVDADLGPLDETFLQVSLAQAREFAWHEGVALTDSPLGVRAALARRIVKVVSTGAADLALTPDLPADVQEALRDAEEDGDWAVPDAESVADEVSKADSIEDEESKAESDARKAER